MRNKSDHDHAQRRPAAGEIHRARHRQLANPMTDADLEAKFADLADGVLPKSQARRLMDLCWAVEKLPAAAGLAKAAAV